MSNVSTSNYLRGAAQLFGGAEELAALMGVPVATLMEWLRNNSAPPWVLVLAEAVRCGHVRSLKVQRDKKAMAGSNPDRAAAASPAEGASP